MHRLLLVRAPRRWWPPRLRPLWIRLLAPGRRLWQRWQLKLRRVEVRGLEHLRAACAAGQGVLITPNHVSYADPFVLLAASDRARLPFYFMTAWQVFGAAGPLRRLLLRQHGCFSVDREGADFRAFRQAVDVLRGRPNPLVIFPEGDLYRFRDRVTPFHEGAARVALAAARGRRDVVCLPAGITYHHVGDPAPALGRLLDRLERAFRWRPARGQTLGRRVERLTEAAVALKELEYLGSVGSGPLQGRIDALAADILGRLEKDYGAETGDLAVPQRVHWLRRQVVERLDRFDADDTGRGRCQDDLDDLFSVLQVFCYGAGDCAGRDDGDRLAAALDHLEEDVLGAPVAAPRAALSAVLTFGRPVAVEPAGGGRNAAAVLTRALERRVQALLDGRPDAESAPRDDVTPAHPQGERWSLRRTASTSASQ
jgi:1-acyl-sn-glycerol-3-phosphate acyltransferase